MSNLVLQPGDVIGILGDSITAGVGQGPWYGPYFTSVNASYTKAGASVTTTVAGPVTTKAAGTVTTSPTLGPANYSPTVFAAGVSGNTVAQMLARVTTDILSHSPAPKVVIIEAGINDVVGGTNLGTFATTVASLISTIQTAIPTVRMMWINAFCYGEQYPDPFNATINSYNAVIQSACASAGVAYCDVRSAQQAYEAIHNTPSPGAISGILCLDSPTAGVHPNSAVGIPLWSTTAFASTTLNGIPT